MSRLADWFHRTFDYRFTVGPWRPGIDPVDEDPHRNTPDDQLPRWHPRALAWRMALGEVSMSLTITVGGGTVVVYADLDQLPDGVRMRLRPSLSMTAGDTLEITSIDIRLTGV